MKYTIYCELNKLMKLYPFCPKTMGFVAIDREATIPSDLSSFN
jgi:hypothetical protein